MISAWLYFCIVPFAVLGMGVTYHSWKKKNFNGSNEKYLFFFFFFYTVYNALLSAPILLGTDVVVLRTIYIVAIVILFFALVPIILTEAEMLDRSLAHRSGLVAFLIAMLGLITALNIMRLPEPYVRSGFVFWNVGILPVALTSVVVFIVGMHIFFITVSRWPKGITPMQSMKARLFMLGSVALSLSALIYFPSRSVTETEVAFVLYYLGTFLLVLSLLIGKGLRFGN